MYCLHKSLSSINAMCNSLIIKGNCVFRYREHHNSSSNGCHFDDTLFGLGFCPSKSLGNGRFPLLTPISNTPPGTAFRTNSCCFSFSFSSFSFRFASSASFFFFSFSSSSSGTLSHSRLFILSTRFSILFIRILCSLPRAGRGVYFGNPEGDGWKGRLCRREEWRRLVCDRFVLGSKTFPGDEATNN